MRIPNGPDRYLEWAVPAVLRRHVACTWTGGRRAHESPAEPVLPDGCMDVIWNGERLFVAGPDRGPVPDAQSGRFTVGLRFRPGMAPLFLGSPADELLEERVDLEEFWPEAAALADELAETASLRQAAVVLERSVVRRLGAAAEPDPLVESVARSWRTDAGCPGLSTAVMAERVGVGERQMRRRFSAAVGYGPKLLQRVLRFQSFLAAASAGSGAGLAELAVRSGYYDQAHLSRESAALAGRTPGELLLSRRHDVRNVQDAH